MTARVYGDKEVQETWTEESKQAHLDVLVLSIDWWVL